MLFVIEKYLLLFVLLCFKKARKAQFQGDCNYPIIN